MLTAEDRTELRARRDEFWSWTLRIAAGIFIGHMALAFVALVVLVALLDSEL